MPATFTRTMRSLEADGSRRRVVELLFAVLIGAWASWFLLGSVTVYEVTEPRRARLEVKTTAHAVVAQVGGRVDKMNLTIGQSVTKGMELVLLNSKDGQLAVAKRRTVRDAAVEQRLKLDSVIRNARNTLSELDAARTAAIKEGDARAAEAKISAKYFENEVTRLRPALSPRAIADADFQKSTTSAELKWAEVETLKLEAVRRDKDRLAQESEARTRLAELERQAEELKGKVAIEDAEIRRLEYEIEKRTIPAPISGRMGEVVAKFQVGSFVNTADKLGVIVPDGETHVVAQFPVASIGRIQPGQLGQLRLDGFPWTQYGTIPVRVAAVGNEATDGFIRVELDLRANSASAVPVGHGLQGSVEVAIEQVSPAVLVLRAAGQFLGTQGSSAQALRDRSEP